MTGKREGDWRLEGGGGQIGSSAKVSGIAIWGAGVGERGRQSFEKCLTPLKRQKPFSPLWKNLLLTWKSFFVDQYFYPHHR